MVKKILHLTTENARDQYFFLGKFSHCVDDKTGTFGCLGVLGAFEDAEIKVQGTVKS